MEDFRKNRYQVPFKDLKFIKKGMHVFADDPETGNKLVEMIVITPPAKDGDVIIIECQVLSHGFTTLLQFREHYECNIYTSKLISEWRTNN